MKGTCSALLSKRWFVLILWQVASLLLYSENLFNTLLANHNGETLPFLQLALAYTLLFLTHIWKYQRSDISWLKYFIVSLFSGAGDCMAIFAYNETSLSSAMLLSTTSIFWVAPLTFFFLKRRLSLVQILSLFIAFTGIVLVCVADGMGSSRWIGNCLSIAAAISYAVSNVLQEALVKAAPATTFLCRFSIFMAPAMIVIGGAIEWKAIAEYNWEGLIVAYVLGYAILLAAFYTCVPSLLQLSSAMEMTISLLTSNFFSLATSIIAFGQKPEWLYLVGFFCVPIAIVLFEVFAPKITQNEATSGGMFERMVVDGAIPEPDCGPVEGKTP
jgi:drug/metabolite transporter (DMT)-like permease